MPILWVLVPIHALAPYPLTLLLIQLLATAAAAVLFLKVQRQQGLDGWLAATKEDAALYVAGFAAVALLRSIGSRRMAAAILGVAVAWFACALFVAIPFSRTREGLGASNPLLESRYGAADGSVGRSSLSDRVASARTARTIVNISASAGFLPLAGLWWVAPAAPGLLANLAASPESMQSALTGHYAWPILPWIFLGASAGALWIQRRSRTAAAAWVIALLLVTVAANPAVQRIGSTRVSAEARQVREQLGRVRGGTILAQPNLLPHLAKSSTVFAVGGVAPVGEPDLVLLTTVGDLWPLAPDEVRALVATYRADAQFVEVESGPLYAFRRR